MSDAERTLKTAYRRESRYSRLFLGATIIVGVLTLTLILNMSLSKLKTEIDRDIKRNGGTMSGTVENADESTLSAFSDSFKIKRTGRIVSLGKLSDDDQTYSECVVTSPDTFRDMLRPSFNDFVGSYPKKASDVVMSMETLRYLGIDVPRIGMRLRAEFYWNDLFNAKNIGMQEFSLVGYYTSKTNNSITYMSDDWRQTGGVDVFPCTLIIEPRNALMNSSMMKAMLTDLIPDDSHVQIECSDSPEYTALVSLSGGIVLAGTFLLLICILFFFFINQIFAAQHKRNVQSIRLLNTLGVTDKQIFKIVLESTFEICVLCSATGQALSRITSRIINRISAIHNAKPLLLENTKATVIIYIVELAFVFSGTMLPIIRIRQPANNAKRSKGQVYKKKKLISEGVMHGGTKSVLFELSGGALLREKKRFAFTVLFLFAGFETALLSGCLSKGADFSNAYTNMPDYHISLTQAACANMRESLTEGEDNLLFSDAMALGLEDSLGSIAKSYNYVKGYMPSMDTDQNSIFGVIKLKNDTQIIIQKFDNKELNYICKYIKSSGLDIDTHDLMNDHGALILSDLFYTDSEVKLSSNIGRVIDAYDTLPNGAELDHYQSRQMIFCGYADISEDKFPDMDLAWDAENTVILAVSKETYKWLGQVMKEQIFSMNIDVPVKLETEAGEKIDKWVDDENHQYNIKKGLVKIALLRCRSKSSLIKSDRNYINFNRMLMKGVSIVLCISGILFLINTIIAEMMHDKREYRLLQYLGLTKKDLLIILEIKGMIYFAATAAMIVTIGTLIVDIVQKVICSHISYFQPNYPYGILALMLAGMFCGCFITSKILLCFYLMGENRKAGKGTFIKKTGVDTADYI